MSLEELLAQHVRVGWAMSVNAKDECSCGARVDADAPDGTSMDTLMQQRHRGFAIHLAEKIKECFPENDYTINMRKAHNDAR